MAVSSCHSGFFLVVGVTDDPEELPDQNIYNIISSVILHFKWPPSEIDQLYFDDIDYHGIIWHYNYIKELVDKLETNTNTNG